MASADPAMTTGTATMARQERDEHDESNGSPRVRRKWLAAFVSGARLTPYRSSIAAEVYRPNPWPS